jgi:hypothetical protein
LVVARRRRRYLARGQAVLQSDAGSPLGATHCRCEHVSPSPDPLWLPRAAVPEHPDHGEGSTVMEETEEPGELVERVAALDIGKASVMACIRVPHEDQRRRRQEVCEYGTTTGALLTLADRLHNLGVTLVAMEATSDYWKPVFYLLEAEGFTCWLLNAKHVKNVPGRPKTDKLDAVWLAKVVERGMCRPSLVHPKPIRELRDLTRYRRTLTHERTREMQRAEKLLEDALLTELRERIAVSGGLASARVVRFRARDQRRGWRTGSVVVEGAALRSA